MDLQQLQRVANFLGLETKPKEARPVRIGVLGASQVATYALVAPARGIPKAEVVAVGARDGKRAATWAKQQGIPRSYGSYEEVLADPEVDAVYVGLPNGLHGHWARRALEAGKHVLCEKPLCANTEEVAEVTAVAAKKGLLLREAFHYREHPLASRLRELVLGASSSNPGLPTWLQAPSSAGGAGGMLGPLTSIHINLLIPRWAFGGANIRFQEQLAGGAMMDAGCYCASLLRLLSGAKPQVTSAQAKLCAGSQVIDSSMRATLSWPSLPGLQGSLHASLEHDGLLPETEVMVTGQRGSLHCKGFVVPFFGHSVRVRRALTQEETSQLASAGAGAGALTAPSAMTSLASMSAASSALASAVANTGNGSSSGAMASRDGGTGPAWLELTPLSAFLSGRSNQEEWVERAYGEQRTTYQHQLDRFVTDLQVLEANTTSKNSSSSKAVANVRSVMVAEARDAAENQELIDSVYRAAGLPERIPTAQWLAERALQGASASASSN